MIRFFLVLFLGTASVALKGQSDTLLLPEFVKSEWRFRQVSEFLPTLEGDSSAFVFYGQGSVAALLQSTTPLFVRNYGPSHVTSVSNRGLAAAHTAVYWNGININAPTTGQADFSLIPSAFVESLDISIGGSSAVMGSGPIGGGVHINTAVDTSQGVHVSSTSTINSAQNLESHLRIKVGSKRWQSVTNLLWHEGQNRFPFVHSAKPSQPREFRQNAHFRQRGLTHRLSRQFGKHRIGMDIWGLETDRALPPALTAADSEEKQYDRNVKTVLYAHLDFGRTKSRIQLGYLDDLLAYSNANNVSSEITSSELIANADFTHQLTNRWHLRFGTNNSLQRALAAGSYDGTAQVLRTALYAGAVFRSRNGYWEASSMLRYDQFSSYRGALSPAVALQYQPYCWGKWQISASRNYRIPGFNDRFWQPGGNPELEPEDAYQLTTGPEIQFIDNARVKLNLSVSGFFNDISNWIQWVPQTGHWGAMSYKSVQSMGFNARIRKRMEWERGSLQTTLNYAYTTARNTQVPLAENTSGKHLPHSPNHKFNFLFSGRYRFIGVYFDGVYTGSRFASSDNTIALEAYFLSNVGVTYDHDFGPFGLRVIARVNNLFNTSYEVMPWMPMPLRTYSLSLSISFKN